MKKLLIFLGLFSIFLTSKGQYPNRPTSGNDKTQPIDLGARGVGVGLQFILNFTDTTAANNYTSVNIKAIPEFLIVVNDTLHKRNITATRWDKIGGASNGGGSGSGSVTNFSSGNLSPLFTTNVLNGTTTPNLSFTLSNASPFTAFGRASGTGAPSFTSLDTTFIANFSAKIRSLFSAGTNVTYNQATGQISSTGGGAIDTTFAKSPLYVIDATKDTIAIYKSDSTKDGYLSKEDWLTFYNNTGSNQSVGTGYKVAINGTKNVKSLTAGLWTQIDSLVSNQVNFKIDSAGLASYFPRRKDSTITFVTPKQLYDSVKGIRDTMRGKVDSIQYLGYRINTAFTALPSNMADYNSTGATYAAGGVTIPASGSGDFFNKFLYGTDNFASGNNVDTLDFTINTKPAASGDAIYYGVRSVSSITPIALAVAGAYVSSTTMNFQTYVLVGYSTAYLVATTGNLPMANGSKYRLYLSISNNRVYVRAALRKTNGQDSLVVNSMYRFDLVAANLKQAPNSGSLWLGAKGTTGNYTVTKLSQYDWHYKKARVAFVGNSVYGEYNSTTYLNTIQSLATQGTNIYFNTFTGGGNAMIDFAGQSQHITKCNDKYIIGEFGLNDPNGAAIRTNFKKFADSLIANGYDVSKRFIWHKLVNVTDKDSVIYNLSREYGFQLVDAGLLGYPTTDGLHPTDSGMVIIAAQLRAECPQVFGKNGNVDMAGGGSGNINTVPGSDKYVIYNDGGVLGADVNLTHDKTTGNNGFRAGASPVATIDIGAGIIFGKYGGSPVYPTTGEGYSLEYDGPSSTTYFRSRDWATSSIKNLAIEAASTSTTGTLTVGTLSSGTNADSIAVLGSTGLLKKRSMTSVLANAANLANTDLLQTAATRQYKLGYGANRILIFGDYATERAQMYIVNNTGTHNGVINFKTNDSTFNAQLELIHDPRNGGSLMKLYTPTLRVDVNTYLDSSVINFNNGQYYNFGRSEMTIKTAAGVTPLKVTATGIEAIALKYVDGNQASGKVLTSDASGNATWQTPGGGGGGLLSSNFVYNEESTGSTSSTYNLANTPVTGQIHIWKNGVSLRPTIDYTISGNTVTLISARLSSDVFQNDYIK